MSSLLGFLLFLTPLPVVGTSADMRCGTSIVQMGDSSAAVESKCGVPTRKQPIYGLRARRGPGGAVVGEEWVYDLGPTQLTRVLDFSNGQLYSLRVGDYGGRD